MFVKTGNDNWINLQYCRQIEIIMRYGKYTIVLRSGIVIPNSGIQSTFLISYFDTKEKAQKCVDQIFQAFRDNEIEYDPRSPETDNVVMPDGELTDDELTGFWGMKRTFQLNKTYNDLLWWRVL